MPLPRGLFVAWLLCATWWCAAEAIPCAEVIATSFQHASFFASVHPFGVRVHPSINNQQQESYLAFNFTSLAERARGSYGYVNLTQSVTQACYHPTGANVDPLSTDPEYGVLLQHYYIKDMDCTSEFSTDTPASGVSRNSYRYIVTNPAMPSLVYNITFYTVNSTYVEVLSTNTTFTDGVELSAVYNPNSMKFSVDIEGWEWQDKGPWPYPVNQSYLQLGGVFGVHAPNGGTINTSNTLLSYNVDVQLSEVTMSLTLDRGYVSNVGAQLPSGLDPMLPTTSLPTIDFSMYLTTAFCNQHWEDLSYDPTLAVLVLNPPSTSPGANSRSIPIAIALGVVLPVLALVCLFILLFLKVPSIHHAILPFSKRAIMSESNAS